MGKWLLTVMLLFVCSALSFASDIISPICEITAEVVSVREDVYPDNKFTYLYVELKILSNGKTIREGEPPTACNLIYEAGKTLIARIAKEKDLVDQSAVIKEKAIIGGEIQATGLGISPQYFEGKQYSYVHILEKVKVQ
jgi:hypothetical protein